MIKKYVNKFIESYEEYLNKFWINMLQFKLHVYEVLWKDEMVSKNENRNERL